MARSNLMMVDGWYRPEETADIDPNSDATDG